MSRRLTDYDISIQDAKELLVAVNLPHELRMVALHNYQKEHGLDAVITLFSQFIGMANSVIANNREMIEMICVTEGGLHPHTAEKCNLPTIFGALNGITLTEGVDQEKTCQGCAFRIGTPANQSPITTCDADYMTQPGEGNFMCHMDTDELDNPTHKCTGFTQSKKYKRIGETIP